MKLRYVPEMMNRIYQDNRKSGKSRLSSMLCTVSRTFCLEFQRIVLRRSYNERLSKALKREKERSRLK